MKSIKDGNPDEIAPRIKRNFAIFLEDSVGKLAQNSFKQNEYMACTALSVATHAAIEGGLNPFIAYSISDLYLQRLEKCKNVLEIYQLIYEFQIEYAQQVKETREKLSRFSYVEECKNYIVSHLRTRFTVEDIAKELNINRSYLSRQFSKSEGMSIQQYILRKRIDVASNMLKFSEESILTISDYLCFATQSHFGKAFKQQTGMTPQKYRKKNKPIDFSSDCSSVMNDTYTTKI
jgi:AraC-like DNA-binding protein